MATAKSCCAQAAKAAGIPFTLSTMSICSIEDVAEAVGKPFWFQLYVIKDRGFSRALIDRATAAKCSALVLTVDLQVLGQRHCDIKNGMTVPPQIKHQERHRHRQQAGLGLEHPERQAQDLRQSGRPREGHGKRQLAWPVDREQFDPTLNWKDVEWIKTIWPGKLVLKGILDVEDARIAAKIGADALVVSNHGGRQLDGAPSSISALPTIADAVGNDIEVLFDGGIRSGADMLRALALGARACLIGRAYIYGLGAGGEAGVAARDRDHGEGTRRRHGVDRHQHHRRNRPPRARWMARRRREGGASQAQGSKS